MTHVYRITKGPNVGELVDSIESVEAFARQHGPDRYDVDEHSLDPFTKPRIATEHTLAPG